MSVTILVIGLAHGVPVALAGLFTRNRVLTLAAAVGMCFVAFATGGDRYIAVDLIGVGFGAWLGWFAALKSGDTPIVGTNRTGSRPSSPTPQSLQEFAQRGAKKRTIQLRKLKIARAAAEQAEAARLKARLEQARPFVEGLFDSWVVEGRITPCREGSDNLFYQWELARRVAYSVIEKSIYSGSLMTVQDDWVRLMKIDLGVALLDALTKAAAAGLYSPAEFAQLKQSMGEEYRLFLSR